VKEVCQLSLRRRHLDWIAHAWHLSVLLQCSLSLSLICVIFFCFQSSYVLSSAVQLKRPQAKLEEEGDEDEDMACAATVPDDKTSVRPTSHEKTTTNRQQRKNYTVRSCKRSSSSVLSYASFLFPLFYINTAVFYTIQWIDKGRDWPGLASCSNSSSQ